ncbi:NfeD family protein [Nocardioides sp. CER19]|uniref:NfeD family protein n=1 Tax=Nocardioides sp. CER19 TaxID=3038538 RepID=UPI002447625B|nr:NfeD family protein [Nocardioides sp. CER19]MDH2415746.1 NfeD family protein [Nocardioides sp. CER19]
MEWLGDNTWAVWLGLAALLTILELTSLDLILEMLAIGALAGMVTSFATDSVVAQILVAVVASIGMLAVVRPGLTRRLHSGPDLVLGPATLIGKQAITPVRLSAHQGGQLKIDGELWTAKPYDETLVIEPGETVEVLQIRGATAYVHPVPTLES